MNSSRLKCLNAIPRGFLLAKLGDRFTTHTRQNLIILQSPHFSFCCNPTGEKTDKNVPSFHANSSNCHFWRQVLPICHSVSEFQRASKEFLRRFALEILEKNFGRIWHYEIVRLSWICKKNIQEDPPHEQSLRMLNKTSRLRGE